MCNSVEKKVFHAHFSQCMTLFCIELATCLQIEIMQLNRSKKFTKLDAPSPRVLMAVIRSRSRKEPHRFEGAGTVTRCGSGSKPNEKHRLITKNVPNWNRFTFPIHIYNHFNLPNSKKKVAYHLG
jgi:hypothetical protein